MLKDEGSMYWVKLMFQDMLSHGSYDLCPVSLQSNFECVKKKKKKKTSLTKFIYSW